MKTDIETLGLDIEKEKFKEKMITPEGEVQEIEVDLSPDESESIESEIDFKEKVLLQLQRGEEITEAQVRKEEKNPDE